MILIKVRINKGNGVLLGRGTQEPNFGAELVCFLVVEVVWVFAGLEQAVVEIDKAFRAWFAGELFRSESLVSGPCDLNRVDHVWAHESLGIARRDPSRTLVDTAVEHLSPQPQPQQSNQDN